MNDPNSPEEIEKRKTQSDPIVMYLIVRESLNMSIGKTAAQCAHASPMLQIKYDKEFHDREMARLCGWDWDGAFNESDMTLYQEWLDTSFRKVVLKADEKEWGKIKAEILHKVIVVDAGLTELEPNTETVIGVWPMKKSEVPRVIKRLQVLK